MAHATLIPVSEYLNTTYRPDCDYIDGELQERNVGERPHGMLQGILFAIFYANRREWGVVAGTELRMHVSAKRYRIPDVTVMRRTDPADAIVQVAPLICIEVLSPRDTLSRMQQRIDDYTRMGVEHIWLVDPISRHAYVATGGGLPKPLDNEFAIPGTPIRIPLTDLFAALDEMLTQG